MTEGANRWTGVAPGERPFRDAAWFYAEYRYRPTVPFLEQLAAHLEWSKSDRILDLGAGPAHVSLPLARLLGEVVVMDPEPAMLGEGRRRAAAAGVDNLVFVLGGSDDLDRLARDLGKLTAVVISQAFHWMTDQDSVLRALDPMLDRESGAIALVGFVKEPDYDRVWLDRSPWAIVGSILRSHLSAADERSTPAGRHDPFPEILARSPFSQVELLTYEYEAVLQPSIDAAIGLNYSLGNLLAHLGARRELFEAEVRAALADADTTKITVRLTDSALVGRRPAT